MLIIESITSFNHPISYRVGDKINDREIFSIIDESRDGIIRFKMYDELGNVIAEIVGIPMIITYANL